MMEEHQESVDISSKKCLGSLCPQENHHIPLEHQVPNKTVIKVESIDERNLQKCREITPMATIPAAQVKEPGQKPQVEASWDTNDLPSNKCLGSGISQEHQRRNMAASKVECVDKEKMSHCQYKRDMMPEKMDASGIRYPCVKKTQRMRKPIKSEILRFGKVERRLEVTLDDHYTGPELLCKGEKSLSRIRADGHSKRSAPERCPQEHVTQNDEALNLTSYERNLLNSKVKDSVFHPDGSNSRSRVDSDCLEDYRSAKDYQTDCIEVVTDEATSQSDSEEEMYLTADQRVKEEDGNEGYEVGYDYSENLYLSATTSRAASFKSNCDSISGVYNENVMDEKQFICSECGKGFSLYSYLNKHQRSHSGEKPFSCGECGKCFTYKPSLISHQRVHTGEKPFSCMECGKLFSSKFNLKMHEKIHSGDKPVVCPACGKCFSNNPALVKHLRIHTGEKPFSCSQCGKFFSSKSGLNAHLIIHTGEKPYMCAECGKSFANHSNLISHRIIHTGEKPYVCAECGKGFANQSNLAKHKVIHTEEKPFLCMECGKFFTRKGSLDKHRMRIHEKEKLA
ncbi:uncharacterized protein LOC142311093 isoform X1 [Anomaloglossus baeobatrachus]|uniref:uncharacterized protein LOC142311093 isoform X1 n=1 Tax=Anomaloglossus baeobatrachus TaxID=238106 RepID=UPI003F5001F6